MQSQVNSPPVDAQVWERGRGEPALWFGRFHVYLLLGWKRSLYGACVLEWEVAQDLRKAQGLVEAPPRPTGTPGAWRRAAERYHWFFRAEAWDKYRADAVEKNVRAAWERLAELLPVAVERLALVLDSEDEEQQRLAATSLLQRGFTLWGGGDPTEKPKEIQFVEFV